MAKLAQGLAAAQFSPKIDRNATRRETTDRQISAASSLKGLITKLASSVGDRVRTGDLSSQPSIANAAVASVSKGTLTGKGTYSLEVTSLAKAQSLTSPAFTSPTTKTGSGSLTLRFGTISGSTFTEDTAHAAATITIPSGATLSNVASAINAANAGVTAYVANGSDGAHLMLKGAEGAANAFVIEANETVGDEGLAALAWTPTSAPAQRLTSSADAVFKLDGLAMTSPSNTINDIAPGLNLQLTGTNPAAPTTIRFGDPSASVTTFMQDFTAALNELVGELNTATDPVDGDLARDPGARGLRQALTQLAGNVIMTGAASDEPRSLADLGLATNRDGTFRLDGARLTATLKASPSGVAAMFTTGLRGVYSTIDKLARSASTSTDPGSLGGSVTRYSALKTKLATEKTELADDQEKLRANLMARFAGVDSRVGASRATLNFLKNQIDAWNAKSN